MIRLVDIESVEEEVTFGTCELCFSVMDYIFEYFVFQERDIQFSMVNGIGEIFMRTYGLVSMETFVILQIF